MARTERPTKVRLRPSAACEQMVRHNLSQNELARRLEITSGYLSQLINGKRSPSPELRQKLLGFLPGATFDQLFVVVRSDPERVASVQLEGVRINGRG